MTLNFLSSFGPMARDLQEMLREGPRRQLYFFSAFILFFKSLSSFGQDRLTRPKLKPMPLIECINKEIAT